MEIECKTDDLGAASDRKKSSAQNYPAIGDCISGAFSFEGGKGDDRANNKAHQVAFFPQVFARGPPQMLF